MLRHVVFKRTLTANNALEKIEKYVRVENKLIEEYKTKSWLSHYQLIKLRNST